jgi:hypothetical protein
MARAGADLTRLDGDFNKDGNVDLADFSLLRNNFGASVSASDRARVDAWAATVPEPGVGVGLLAVAGLSLRRRSSRRAGIQQIRSSAARSE